MRIDATHAHKHTDEADRLSDEEQPKIMDLPDIAGDTPLHVAISWGQVSSDGEIDLSRLVIMSVPCLPNLKVDPPYRLQMLCTSTFSTPPSPLHPHFLRTSNPPHTSNFRAPATCGRAASGLALAPEPPRATRSQPESIRNFYLFFPFFLGDPGTHPGSHPGSVQ